MTDWKGTRYSLLNLKYWSWREANELGFDGNFQKFRCALFADRVVGGGDQISEGHFLGAGAMSGFASSMFVFHNKGALSCVVLA